MRTLRLASALVAAGLWSAVAAGAQKPDEAPPPFRDVAAEAGIAFRQSSAPEKKYILESMPGGLALLDFDDDGLLDVYFVNSLTVGNASNPESAPSALYKNLGGMRFKDVSKEAGVQFPGWGMGACVADVDGDGRQDLYVTAVGDDKLYRGVGDGSFEDVTRQAGIVAGGWSTGCGFADYDRDGDLDLFVSRYVEVDLKNLPEFGKGKFCVFRGVEVQCGPRGLPGTGDLFFRNEGKGPGGVPRFEEVGKKAGVSDPEEYFGLGIAWFDSNADGWLDLFVANDSGPNLLYMNQKDGTFIEDAFPLGVAVSDDGSEQGCMGVAVGDYKNEGRLSVFVTNFADEHNVLYKNAGDFFTDESFRSAGVAASLLLVGWGTTFFDYDNDGWLDLIAVNGHVYPQMAHVKMGASASYKQRKLFYRNRLDGTFEEIGEQFGEVFTDPRVSRGLVLGDLDNDGRLDLVINTLDGTPQVLHNQVSSPGHWLLVKLEGSGKMTDAIGAVIKVKTGEEVRTRLIRSGTSYLSQEDMRQHFGLGTAKKVDAVEVLWPDGTTTVKKGVDADQLLVIRQPPTG